VRTAATRRRGPRADGAPEVELGVDLPVYPDGAVTLTLPVVVSGTPVEAVIGYAACSATRCLFPVTDKTVTCTRRPDGPGRQALTGRPASPGRDQRRERQAEFAGVDGGQVRVDLGVVGQPGRDQLAAHVP
jgi:hypothetical protein